MQDRANVSADFLELMKQEIIEVIKKYIEVDEGAIDVRLTNKENEDGTNGAPALYANIPIKNIKNEARKVDSKEVEKKKAEKEVQTEEQKENKKQEDNNKQPEKEQEEIKAENKEKEESKENQKIEEKDKKEKQAKDKTRT